jgi:hypothetical protein
MLRLRGCGCAASKPARQPSVRLPTEGRASSVRRAQQLDPNAPPIQVSAPELTATASSSSDGQMVLIFGMLRAELSLALASMSGGTVINLDALVQLARSDGDESVVQRLEDAAMSSDTLVPFKLALPLLLRRLSGCPAPFFLCDCVRTAAHAEQLHESVAGRLGLAVQAGPCSTSSERTLSAFLAKNNVIVHAANSCDAEQVAQVHEELPE